MTLKITNVIFYKFPIGGAGHVSIFHLAMGLSSILLFLTSSELAAKAKHHDHKSSFHDVNCQRWREERNFWISVLAFTMYVDLLWSTCLKPSPMLNTCMFSNCYFILVCLSPGGWFWADSSLSHARQKCIKRRLRSPKKSSSLAQEYPKESLHIVAFCQVGSLSRHMCVNVAEQCIWCFWMYAFYSYLCIFTPWAVRCNSVLLFWTIFFVIIYRFMMRFI